MRRIVDRWDTLVCDYDLQGIWDLEARKKFSETSCDKEWISCGREIGM